MGWASQAIGLLRVLWCPFNLYIMNTHFKCDVFELLRASGFYCRIGETESYCLFFSLSHHKHITHRLIKCQWGLLQTQYSHHVKLLKFYFYVFHNYSYYIYGADWSLNTNQSNANRSQQIYIHLPLLFFKSNFRMYGRYQRV